MHSEISTQYNEICTEFIKHGEIGNSLSRNAFYSILDFDFTNKKLLDIGCGDGFDLEEYNQRGAIVYGLDASLEMLNKAKERINNANFTLGFMENLPYPNDDFDIVLSKYALQISKDIPKAISEIARVLKPGGIFAYLASHPLRQFLEKNRDGKDYFLQEIVESQIFGGKVTLYEPSHSLNEYICSEFLSNFRLLHFEEQPEFPDSRRINGDNYPCFFLIKAQKLA